MPKKPEYLTFLREKKSTLHSSHRGGSMIAPENTVFAFAKALNDYKTDLLELDVHLSGDGEIVVCHDPFLERVTEITGMIKDMDLARIQEADAAYWFTQDDGRTYPLRGKGIKIPTLEEVLSEFPGTYMNIDIKAWDRPFEKEFADIVGKYERTHLVCAGSSHKRCALRLKQFLPDSTLFFPWRTAQAFYLYQWLPLKPEDLELFHVLDLPVKYHGLQVITRRLINHAHKHGKYIMAWTVNDLETMERLVEWGVDGIMTDRPDVLREVLGN